MIKLKDILMERVSDVVYHFTTTDAAGGIIDTNRFRLQPIPVGTNVDPGRKYDEGYYMSVARTKVEAYTKNAPSSRCYFVRFELDGNKLGNRYKGGAYNYYYGQHGNDDYEEYEDRIYSKTGVIPNAKDYIKRMDLDVSRECPRQSLDGGYNPKVLIEIATGAGVPTFLFPSRDKWSQQSGGVEVKNVKEYEQILATMKQGM